MARRFVFHIADEQQAFVHVIATRVQDLYPHHFDALHPGTKHTAYNLNETSSCENLNMMLADPGEVLPPVSSHKPKPR